MSNTSIQLKKSGATGNTPTGLAFGEVAINYADGKLYYKNALGGTSYISNQFSFDTINANNSLILATGVSDTLSFVAGNNITISTNTTTKTITINSTGVSDTYARDTANAAFIQANAAFLKANTPDSFIFNGTSNLYFSSANGSIVANVGGNTIATVTNTGIQMAGAEGDLSGANNIYANTVIAANGIIVSGLNVVPYLQSAFTTANTPSHVSNSAALYANASFIQANAAFIHANAAFNAANTGGSGSGNASFIFSGTSNVYFSSANGSIVANVGGNTIATVTNTGIQMTGVEGDISGANNVYANTIIANTNVTISGLNVVSYLQSAFTTANTPSHVANSAALYANAAFVQANAAFIKANTGASASYIFNGTSNVYFETANGNIVANVGGNTIATVSTTGIQISGAEGDLSGANNVYANTFIANTSLTVAGLNVLPYLQSAFTAANTPSHVANSAALYANGAFNKANSITSGFRANTLIVANSTGFLSNSNAEFSAANNTLYVPNANISNEVIANSLVFYDGTRLNSATGISANTAATANVSIYAKITNVTTGVYYPIVTDTTITGSDTFHYSSNDFVMYAANNTFRASGNIWAGTSITVGSNIPVVNSTGHWVGQTVNGVDASARSNAASAGSYANSAFTTANNALPKAGGTVTGNLTLSTTATMIIQNTTTATSNSTGALIVKGGVGIAGNLYVGGVFTVDGDFSVGNTTSTGNVFNSGYVTFSQPTLFTSNAAATSNATGAIVVAGGIGVKGNIHSGSITITGPTSNGITFADATFQNTAFTSGIYSTLNVTTVVANTASSTANTALLKAQTAYDLANTASQTLSIITDKFVANGNTTTFTLSTIPVTENFVTLVVDGVTQMRDTYSISGNVVTFNSTFENTANIEATTITGQGTISGATGGGTDRVFQVNETIITKPYTLTTGRGASSVGPIVINDGIAVTIGDGARWVIL